MRIGIQTISGLAVLLATFSAVHAARVVPVSGVVSVNSGSGFAQINGPTSAKTGDSVVVGDGGKAKIECDDGTVLDVQPGQIVTICNPPAGANIATGSTAGAGGLGTGALVGAGVIAGGIGIAVAAGGKGNKDKNPASP